MSVTSLVRVKTAVASSHKLNSSEYFHATKVHMLKDTPLRTAILSLLQKHHYLSAYELLGLLDEQGVSVNITSIYRSLEILIQQKRVFRQLFNNQNVVYERSDNHHDHLICLSCGTVKNVPCSQPAPKVQDFQLVFHTLNFYGYCASCQTAK